MRSFFLLSLFVFLFLQLTGCGTQRPFSRGENRAIPGSPIRGEGEKQTQGGANDGTSRAVPLRRDLYDQKIRPLLQEACASCHENPGVDYEKALQFSKPGLPEESSLYTKTIGKDHGGGAIFEVGSPEEKLLRSWILGAP